MSFQKKGMTPSCDYQQGRQDLNLQPPVLETGTLPIELRPYARFPGRCTPDSVRSAICLVQRGVTSRRTVLTTNREV